MNTKGKIISPNTTVRAGTTGDYQHYPYYVKARIVDTSEPSRNSDWLQVDVNH